MSFELARDNQWWYSKSELREQVEQCAEIILCVNGRACRMRHAAPDKNGRVTHSFTFLEAEDRAYWRKLAEAGAMVDIGLGGWLADNSGADPGVTSKGHAMSGRAPMAIPAQVAADAPLTVGQVYAASR